MWYPVFSVDITSDATQIVTLVLKNLFEIPCTPASILPTNPISHSQHHHPPHKHYHEIPGLCTYIESNI